MAPASHVDKKKIKKPPTFQHLPEHRAKKLKKEWVDKQKIQSKWKAQKKREGIVTLRDARKSATTVGREGFGQEDAKGAGVVENAEDDHMDDVHASSEGESNSSEEAESDPAPIPPPSKTRKGKDVAPEEEELSYRELQRRAYSRESLHHHKSGRGGKPERGTGGRFRGASRGSFSGRGRGRGNERGRGGRGGSSVRGGQPDMRLRMSALLEKIKHDVGQ